MRGALRTSRTRGGMRWTQKARETHAPDAYGEVVWFRRRGAGAKLAIRSAGDGGKRAVLREEHEISRKAIAQGRPECSRCPVCSCACFCLRKIARGTVGAASTRSSLRPLFQGRDNEHANLGRNASREYEAVSASLRAQRRSFSEGGSNPCLDSGIDGLLRFARNDDRIL